MATFADSQDAAIQLFNLELLETIPGPPQIVSVYRHPLLGRVLTINDELHHVEAWQELYHEPLVHLPISFVPTVRSVLLLGGGCLFAAQEILKYASVRRLDLIEHDENVINAMVRHYDHAATVLADHRLHVTIADARSVFGKQDRRYDVIICDCFDLSTEGDREKSAYLQLQDLLLAQGICSEVFYRHMFDRQTVHRSLIGLRRCSNVRVSLIGIPEYPGVLHIHALWGKNRHLVRSTTHPANLIQKQHLRTPCLNLRFYDPSHRAFFLYAPPYLRAVLGGHL
jgi:spermidine synthase